ncbi:TPA: hypothetical protein ENG04_02910 [Candidatus Poribacteria bacterium]|nr:hypothetical protein [Candidatus Poribacteria bacterium]HEX29015.1 hypothetical protein [Candidatus Poribacteria bacterium]
MRLRCRTVRGLLSEYIDGDLSPELHVAISAHLSGCERCRREIEELRRTVELVREEEIPMPSESHFDELWSGITAEIEEVAVHTGFKLYLMRGLRSVRETLEGWGISWKIKYVVVTLALILLSLIVDRTLFRPSVDEILFNTIQRSLSSEEAPFLAIEVPRYSNRPITADYKTGLILRKDKGRFQVMGVMINLKSVQIKDGVLTLVGDIDLSKPPEGDDLPRSDGIPAPELKLKDIALSSPSRVWLSDSPKPRESRLSEESLLRSMIYADTDAAFANVSIGDLN